MSGALVLLRHGESAANQAGIFTGLLDIPLTALGEAQARHAGCLLAAHRLAPDMIVTSTLRRATRTADLVREVLRQPIATRALWELNERNYGALTGREKTEVRAELGDDAYTQVRRSRDGRPAPMPLHQWFAIRRSPALQGLPPAAVQRTESLSDVSDRILPVLHNQLLPMVQAGQTVLIVAHGNSLRALCAVIDDLTDSELADLNLPTGQPLLYRLSTAGVFQPRGGEYLDPTAAHYAAALVAAEGGT